MRHALRAVVPSHGRAAIMALATILAVATIVGSPAASAAQSGDVLPRTTRLPASTRAMALGDAYPMQSGHADAIFYHPALLTSSSGFGLDLERWGSSSTAAAASAAVQWLGGGVGIGLQVLQYGIASAGAPLAPPGIDHLFDSGPEAVSERVATVAYARETFFEIDVGVAMSLADVRAAGSKHEVALFDVSFAREIEGYTLGLTVSDIGPKPLLDTGDGPSRVQLGAGRYGQQLGPLDLGYAATVAWDDDEVTYGGGLEVAYWPVTGRTFVGRIGFQDVPEGSDAWPVTFGAAFWGDDITVEWAFRPVDDASEGGSHRFGVRWR